LKVRDIPDQKVDVWVHCSSLGEIMAAKPLVEGFLKRGYKLLVSVFTGSGVNKAAELWGTRATIIRFPLDSRFHLKQIVEKMEPKVFVNLETELWPNLLSIVRERGMSSFLVNARISEKNFKRSMLLKRTYKKMLSTFTKIFSQSQEDRERLVKLGADPKKVIVSGNIKIDSVETDISFIEKKSLSILGEDFVVMFASMREKEEPIVFDLSEKILNEILSSRVVLAPRHLERLSVITKELERRGLAFSLWSDGRVLSTRVLIIDTLGELRRLYGIADVVVMGGTLVPYGGHNVLEAIAAKKVVIVGPYFQNIKEEVLQLMDQGGVIRVNTIGGVFEIILSLYQHRDALDSVAQNAFKWLISRKGISEKILEEILVYLEKH
jgi:3-deoxy-D-manno-octulosonic-acid transferase